MILKALVYLPFNHLTWLLAQEHFIEQRWLWCNSNIYTSKL